MTKIEDHEPIHEDVRYEKTDASTTVILGFAVALIVFGFLAHGVLTSLFGLFAMQEKAKSPPLAPLVAREQAVLPRDLDRISKPLLEESNSQGLRDLRKEEDGILNHYGWVDRKAGVARIPIEEAIRILSQPKNAAAHGIKARADGN